MAAPQTEAPQETAPAAASPAARRRAERSSRPRYPSWLTVPTFIYYAIFFLGHRDVALDAQQRADLAAFVKDEGKGFVAAHVALTAFDSWPEFSDLLGGTGLLDSLGSAARTAADAGAQAGRVATSAASAVTNAGNA
jgi:hypothetical protein